MMNHMYFNKPLGVALAILVLWVASVSEMSGDIVHLKNGRSIDGLITGEDATRVVVNVGVGAVTLQRARIASIERSDAAGQDEIKNQWGQHYFAHARYAPEGLEALARGFKDLEGSRRASLEASAALARLQQERGTLNSRFKQLEQQWVRLSGQLKSTTPASGVEAYNELVGRHNTLYGKMVLAREAFQKNQQLVTQNQKTIATYLQSLKSLQRDVANRSQGRDTLNEDAGRFLDELNQRVISFNREFELLEIPHEVEGGHLVLKTRINGTTDARLLLDTGATFVSITEALARRLNLNLENRNDIPMTLANGSKAMAKPVLLELVQVADAKAVNVPAVVIQSEETSLTYDGLLGMSFLREFNLRLDPASGKLALTRFVPR